jgi:hypothetical protein
MVIYIYMFTMDPPPRVETLGLKLDMWLLPDGGHPPITVMTAFTLGNGVESLPSGPSLGLVPQVSDRVILKLRIMPQSLSLCLTG